jgi:hypothetical protein
MEAKNQPTSKEGTEEGKWNKLGKLGELNTQYSFQPYQMATK